MFSGERLAGSSVTSSPSISIPRFTLKEDLGTLFKIRTCPPAINPCTFALVNDSASARYISILILSLSGTRRNLRSIREGCRYSRNQEGLVGLSDRSHVNEKPVMTDPRDDGSFQLSQLFFKSHKTHAVRFERQAVGWQRDVRKTSP